MLAHTPFAPPSGRSHVAPTGLSSHARAPGAMTSAQATEGNATAEAAETTNAASQRDMPATYGAPSLASSACADRCTLSRSMATAHAPWLWPLALADGARRAVLRALGRHAPRWFSDREVRVAWMAAFVVVTAWAGTTLTPLWLLALGPVLLGVPHLVSDVRYLVVRRGLHRRRAFQLGVGAPLLAVALHPDVRVGLVATAFAIAFARASRARKAAAFAAWALVLGASHAAGRVADVAFAHAHNLIALGLWWAWRPRRLGRHLPAIALFALASIAILAGAVEPVLRRAHGFVAPATGLDWSDLVVSLSPVADPVIGFRLVLWFAFAQSVHYGVWLRLIPEDDRVRRSPRSFASSFRALQVDFGAVALAACAACALAIALWGCVDLAAARDGYLRLAQFHGHLELAVAAIWILERSGRRCA